MTPLSDRIHGALLGAAIGAELGFARFADGERFAGVEPEALFALRLEPVAGDFLGSPSRYGAGKMTPYVDLGVRAYLTKGGRVTPEDFGALLKDDAAIAAPVFSWDGMHTVQELLKEGMHPRISGLGNAPCGLIAAAMPAVGIFHATDVEYAYLDGVELASVAQPRLGADWAGLCAAAVACAFQTDATPRTICDTTMKLAHRVNKDVFYQLNQQVRNAGWRAGNQAELIRWWLNEGGRGETRQEMSWAGFNPLYFVLPLLSGFTGDARQLMTLLLAPPSACWLEGFSAGRAIPAIIAGAILGALGGAEAFPAEWRAWAEPLAAGWQPLAGVVEKRLQKEAEVSTTVARLAEAPAGGTSLLFDKIYGCLLAGAIGNAMGSPMEGQLYLEIDAKYPGGVTTVLDPARLEGEDDNQMAMLLVETYLERDGLPVMARHFGETWQERLNRDHFFPLCMGNAYDLIRQGWDPRVIGHWSVVTGSTVMCMEPVGLYHAADPEFAAIDAAAISYMYQRGLDVAAAVMLAATTAEALRPEATVDSVLQAALNAASPEPFRTFDQRPFASPRAYLQACLDVAAKYDDVLAARAELYEKCLLYHQIDPLELWGLSLAMFKIADGDVRRSAIGGTNIGRDSDTIAGRAAMLSGTLRGAANVPAEWKALFSTESLNRIQHNAARLVDLIAIKKAARLRLRQARVTV